MNILDLPNEILIIIISKLEDRSLLFLCCSSKIFYDLFYWNFRKRKLLSIEKYDKTMIFSKRDIFFLKRNIGINKLYTLFLISCTEGRIEIIKLLYEKYKQNKCELYLAILGSIRGNHPEVFEFLINEGVEINDDFWYKEMLKASVENGYINILAILSHMKNIDIETYEKILHISVKKGNLKIVKYLLFKQKDISKTCIDKLLYIATKYNYVDIIKFLLNKGADPRANNDASLRIAAFKRNLGLTKLLTSRVQNIR